LLDLAQQNKQVVLCLDEAQAMPQESLEAIRLLTNLETEKHKLLQIVLFGQPELNQTLQQNSMRQLNQRITFQYHLGPLRRDDMDYYLSHRLNVAGFSGGRLFSRGAARQLYGASGGIPRLVNVVAHKALMLAYGEGRQQVKAHHVRVAARDTVAARNSLWHRWAIAAALLLMAGSVIGWMVLR
jgi:MSHA biogenesis protein MshM